MKFVAALFCVLTIFASISRADQIVLHGPMVTKSGTLSPFQVRSDKDSGALAVSVSTPDLLKLINLFGKFVNAADKGSLIEIARTIDGHQAIVTEMKADSSDYALHAAFKGTASNVASGDSMAIEVTRKYIGNGSDYELQIEIGRNIRGCDNSYFEFKGTVTHVYPSSVYTLNPKSVKRIETRMCS